MNAPIAPDASAPSDPDTASRLTGNAIYVIGLLTLVNLINYMDRMALSVLAPLVKADLALTDAQLGLLVGFAFSIFYAICGIPIARSADRGVRKHIISWALIVWSAMTAFSGTAVNFWHLFLARAGVAAGEAGCIPPAQSIICDYVPPAKRPAAFAVHSFGLSLGSMCGMALAGLLGQVFGWRIAFLLLGLPGLLVAAVVFFTLREPRRGRFDGEAGAATASLGEPLIAVFTQISRNPTYALLLAYVVVNGFVHHGIQQWLPSFYGRSFDLQMAVVGPTLGLAIGVGSGLGMLGGGLFANRLAHRNIRLPLFLGAASIAFSAAMILGALFVGTAAVSMTLVCATFVLWSVPAGAILAIKLTVTPASIRATAGAVTIFLTSVLGFGLGPFCVGIVSDLFAPTMGREALRYALLAPISLMPIMVLLLVFGAKSLPTNKSEGAQIA